MTMRYFYACDFMLKNSIHCAISAKMFPLELSGSRRFSTVEPPCQAPLLVSLPVFCYRSKRFGRSELMQKYLLIFVPSGDLWSSVITLDTF